MAERARWWKNHWEEIGFTTREGPASLFICVLLAPAVTWWKWAKTRTDGAVAPPTSLVSFSMNLIAFFSDCYFMLVTLCNTIWLAVSVNSSCAALAAVWAADMMMMIQLYGFCRRVCHRVSLCLLTHNEYLRRSSPGYCEKKWIINYYYWLIDANKCKG